MCLGLHRLLSSAVFPWFLTRFRGPIAFLLLYGLGRVRREWRRFDFGIQAEFSRRILFGSNSPPLVAFSGPSHVFGKFLPWPPLKLRIWKMSPTDLASCWLLIWLVSTYVFITTDFWIQVSALDKFWTAWLYRCLVRFLDHKMVRLARVWIQLLKETKSAFRHLLKHTFFIIVATVMTV
jgi:hypothetical protein